MYKAKCSRCGKVFDMEYPVTDNVPENEIKCKNCEETKNVKTK